MSYKINRYEAKPMPGTVTLSLVNEDRATIDGVRGIYFEIDETHISVGTIEKNMQYLRFKWCASKGEMRRFLEAVLREGDV